ncbi:MAG: site-specific DNA-methyltransferase [Clostridia bacterium]|nr:site-specific DNA-methyltransferase [Clostridia bacterium]
MRSKRNKTIDFSAEDGAEYLNKCVSASDFNGEENVIILGDFFSALNGVKDASVDLLIVDPPYNLFKDFGGSRFNKLGCKEYADYTEKWMNAVLPKLKKTASVYVCCDWESSLVIGTVMKKYFTLRNRITWEREKGRGAKRNWKNSMEDIFFATVGSDYKFNLDAVKIRRKVLAPYKENGEPKDWTETKDGKFRDTCPSNFWDDISVPYWSMAENTAHPTQKPEKLIAKLILASSDTGDLVLDPFAGSGTTAVVAKKLGRRFIGIEQNPTYCAWAEYRLEKAEEDDSIQGFKDGVFWDRNAKIR